MANRKLLAGIGLLALVGAWYAFRPERLFINEKVNENFPAASAASTASAPKEIAIGRFHGVAHDGKGVATVFELPGGKRVLRLSEFETSNGPQLHLYLVAAPDATDNDTVKNAGFLDLGPLKGNVGDQNYDLPANTDLSKYRAVTVWCARFNVNFTTAPLATSMTGAAEPAVLLSGQFRGIAHETMGTATIYRLADGKRVLRFTGFSTSNGPDVQVYMVAAPDAADNDTVTKSGFVNVGALKGNQGDQNYELPANLDLNKYRAVTVWCRRFGVNFGTAPLAQ